MKQAKIIADSREKNAELLGTLASSGVDVETKTIHVGDFVLSDRVCVERKTVSDFESSIINGRLFAQIKRLREHYSFPILIIEGNASEFGLGSRVMNGTIAALYTDYGIVALPVRSASDAAEVMASIAKREQSEASREPSPKGGMRTYTSQQLQERIIGNLPGVGPKLSRLLLAHFGSIRSIAEASKDELMKVDKIGKKKAELVHGAFNCTYRSSKK